MTDLTEKWKAGKVEALAELIKQIEEVDNRRALSDEYLIDRNNAPRSEYAPAEECSYGIVWVISDYVLPYLKELQALKEENARLKELLKECLPIVSAEIMTWQIRGGEESRKKGKELLTKIEEALK